MITNGKKKNTTITIPPLPNNGIVGGSGGLAILGGGGFKAAKGAFNLIKSLIKGRNIAKPVTEITKRTTSIKNPIEGSNKTYNKLQYPTGKKNFTSKPVDYKGPDPAHKTGAGGNSY